MLDKVKHWLATSPVASFVKVMVGAALGALLSYVTTAQVEPWIVAIVSAFAPVAINALNSSDPRYGKGSSKDGE